MVYGLSILVGTTDGITWQCLSVPRNRSADFNAYPEQKMRGAAGTPRGRPLDEVMGFASRKSKP